MKNSQNRLFQLKYQLNEKKKNGVKSVTWKLTALQKEYIEGQGYVVDPVLYSINTRKIVTPYPNGLTRHINRAWKRGQKRIFRYLKKSELKALEEIEVSCTPFKYKIHL